MDKKIKIPNGIHVIPVKELIELLEEYDDDAPVFFASSFDEPPMCTLSVYNDKVGQVWIDIGPVDDD